MANFVTRNVVEVDWNENDKGREVVGRLVNIEAIQYKDGPGLVYVVKTKTPGEIVRMRGASRLNQRLHVTDIGKLIAVRYNGLDNSREMPIGMSYPKDFTVGVDDASGPRQAEPANVHGVAVTDDDIPF